MSSPTTKNKKKKKKSTRSLKVPLDFMEFLVTEDIRKEKKKEKKSR